MMGGGQRPFGTFPKIHPFWSGEASLTTRWPLNNNLMSVMKRMGQIMIVSRGVGAVIVDTGAKPRLPFPY